MSYSEMAQLELMNAAANVTSQEDLDGRLREQVPSFLWVFFGYMQRLSYL